MEWDKETLTLKFTHAEALALRGLGGKNWLHAQLLRAAEQASTYGSIEIGRRLGLWLASRAEVAPHHIEGVTSSDAYVSFADWWKEEGFGPAPTHRMFGIEVCRHLHALGLQRKRTAGGYVLVGLRLNPAAATSAPVVPAEQP